VEEQQKRKAQRIKNIANKANPFLPGLVGDQLTKREESYFQMIEKFEEEEKEKTDVDEGWFCLPCDVVDEVHSKPPSYRHIQTNRYDPQRKPERLQASSGVCQCINVCDDACLNRMLYMECSGECGGKSNSKASNCNVGIGCGNRMIGQRKFKKCVLKREQGKGWGLVANENIRRGELVQEYVGEVIDSDEKEKRLEEWTAEHPNDPNFYMMQLSPGWFLDARLEGNLSRFANHSCDPNCDLSRVNVGGYIRNGIFAKRDIEKGEFISYDYQFDTKLDRFVCRCGAKNCRGNMKGGVGKDDTKAKSKAELWEEAKARYERDKKFVSEHFEREERRRSQVAATVPTAEGNSELVANGVQARFRAEAAANRIFLWRNAVRGSDFVNRSSRLEAKK